MRSNERVIAHERVALNNYMAETDFRKEMHRLNTFPSLQSFSSWAHCYAVKERQYIPALVAQQESFVGNEAAHNHGLLAALYNLFSFGYTGT